MELGILGSQGDCSSQDRGKERFALENYSLQPHTDLHMQMKTLPNQKGGARGDPPHSGTGLWLDCVPPHRVEKPHNSTGTGQRNQMDIDSVVGKNQPQIYHAHGRVNFKNLKKVLERSNCSQVV